MSTNKKVEQLCERLGKESGCTVRPQWMVDFCCCRLHFEKDTDRNWRYILDVYQGDIDKLDVDELVAHLEAGKWQQVLQTYSGKLVPCFKEKKFAAATTFREWPKKVNPYGRG
jgi:hypothetical protein